MLPSKHRSIGRSFRRNNFLPDPKGGRRTLRGTETKLGPLLQQMGTELLRAHGGTRRGWGYTDAQEQYIMLQHGGGQGTARQPGLGVNALRWPSRETALNAGCLPLD